MATPPPLSRPVHALALRALCLTAAALLAACLVGCAAGSAAGSGDVHAFRNTELGCGWEPVSSLELEAAEHYTIDRYEGGYSLLCISDGSRYLLIPEGKDAPSGIDPSIALIKQPVGNAYLAATDTMCLVDALGVLDSIALSSIKASDCSVEGFRTALEDGSIAYGGKYNMPDYELILQTGTTLAIESTMIEHAPDVREQLTRLGVTVLTERSSYESTAVGRMEWIKLYGEIFGKQELAKSVYDEQVALVKATDSKCPASKNVAFFYINSRGMAVVRQSGDYVPQMIELAGGSYIFKDLSDNTARSTMNIEMERFYATAQDADIIIYNTSIDQSPRSIQDLVEKNALLAKLKAVREGQVWVTSEDMYQQMIRTGDIIADMHAIIAGDPSNSELAFFKRLKDKS